MQPLPDFEALERLKKFLASIRLTHAPTMEHYRAEDGLGFYHQAHLRKKSSLSSTATCVAALVHANLWNEKLTLWNNTHLVARRLIKRPWRSAGLERDNPFSVGFITEGVLELQKAKPKYVGAKKHLQLIRTKLARILIRSFDSGSIKIEPYPPSAYLTQLAYRVLRELNKIDDSLAKEIHTWSRREITKQISLISAKSRSADPLSLAYSLILAASTAKDEDTSPEDKRIFLEGLALFFQAQHEDGTWPASRPLFHYASFGNAYCYEYEVLTQLLRCRPLRNDLLPFITPYIERAAYRLETTGYVLNTATDARAVGWPSGHHPQIEGPESWSTASVYDFAFALNGLVAEAIRRVMFAEFGSIYSPPEPRKHDDNKDDFAKTDFLDADLVVPARGRHSLRKTLAESFVYPISREVALVDRGGSLSPLTPMSAILFGPPGTSKTRLASFISTYLGWPLLSVDPSYVVQDGVDKIQAQANRLFRMLTVSEQVVVLLDEFDELGRDRSGNNELLSRFITTAMLPKLASINAERKIVFLLATNYMSGFDAAFRRGGRFDMLVQVMPPNAAQKLAKWTSLNAAFRRLSTADKSTARAQIADLTYPECLSLAAKLRNVTAVKDIIDIVEQAHSSCTLSDKVEGTKTWKAVCEEERALIRIPEL
jgi:hypothetical protein